MQTSTTNTADRHTEISPLAAAILASSSIRRVRILPTPTRRTCSTATSIPAAPIQISRIQAVSTTAVSIRHHRTQQILTHRRGTWATETDSRAHILAGRPGEFHGC